MAGDEAKQKKARTRSPAYPYLALPEALERTAQLRRAEGRHAVSVAVAMQHWGYKAESSTGYSCIAALKKFGLVDEEGMGENREVRLSALALALLLDAEGGTPERAAALRTAALNPRIHAELWERYGSEPPSDHTLRRFLLLERNFNEASVDEFIAEYRATITYAGLAGPGSASDPVPALAPAPVSRPAGDELPRRRAETPKESTLPGLLEGGEPAAALGAVPARRGRPDGEPPDAPRGARAGTSPRTEAPEPPTAAGATGALPRGGGGGANNGWEGSGELPVPLDDDLVARVPYPMSEESFALLIDTLQLWKKRLVRPKS